jgi:putative transposase
MKIAKPLKLIIINNQEKIKLSNVNNGYNNNLISQCEFIDKLWLPNDHNSMDIKLNLNKGSTENIMNNSWFSCKKISKIHKPDIIRQLTTPELLVKTTSTKEVSSNNLRIKIIRLNMDKSPIYKAKIKEAIYVTRALYNMCIDLCCREIDPIPVNLKTLREMLNGNKKTNILTPNLKEVFDRVPSGIRDEALRDFVKAYEIQIDLVKRNKITHFEMKHKKRKNSLQETIVLHHKEIHRKNNGDIYCFPIKWGKEILNTYKEKLPDIIDHDCRLIMKTIGNNEKFYLAIPTDIKVISKIKKLNAVSLDPGVKIFQTTYDTEGTSYLIGEDDSNKIDRLSKIAQKMRDGIKRDWIGGDQIIKNGKKKLINRKRNFREATTEKEKKGLLKAAAKIECIIKNKISDIHRKTAKFLCEKYDTIIIPNFRVKQMAEKRDNNDVWKRKIGKETTRKMINWKHFQFRQLLIAKGLTIGTNVYVGTEEYTSKTCGNCFWINTKLKGERELQCENCNLVFHRDINAARNILILNCKKSALKQFKIKLNIIH